MDTQACTFADDSAKSDVVKSPGRGSDKISGDALSIIRDMQTTLARQNDHILSQIKGISSDIGNMKRDIAKVTKTVSKLDTARDRETYAANTLQCEFRTFSLKVVSTLRSIKGNDDLSDCVEGYWNEYFHGEESVLSNFYMSPLHVNGLEFKSAEHMYQYKKAEFHGRERDVGEEILHAKYGAAAKGAASRNIAVCSEWEEEKEEIMFQILCLKAEQCTEFADKLHATGSRPLIHDLPVYLWGWGTHGQGLNLMGRILERVRGWMQTGNPSGITARNVGQQKTHNEEEDKTQETQPREPVRREDHQKNAPVSQEERKQKSPKKKNRNSDSQGGDVNKRIPATTDFSTGKDEDWPGLPQPGTKDSKRHVTSDNKSKSLQVEVMGDSQGQKQDHEGTDHRQQPHQRQGKGRGLLADKHGKGYGGRRGGGGYNNRDSGRWNDKGYHYSEEQDKSTDSSAHEQLNDTEYHDDPPTHTERQGHTGGRGIRRGSSHWKQQEQKRSSDSTTPEQINDPEHHDDPHTERHEHTSGRGSSRRGNFHYEQRELDRSTDSTSQKQLNDPEHHEEPRTCTDDRHVETYKGGRRGSRRGSYSQRGSRYHDSYSGESRGSRHQDSYSGESQGSRHHDYNSGESHRHHYRGGRRKAPYQDYADRMYSDHCENPGDNSGHGRPERREDSNNFPSDRDSHHTDMGIGVPPGFAKGQSSVGRGRPITNAKEGGADRHVTLGQDQCQVTLDCHPTINSVSE